MVVASSARPQSVALRKRKHILERRSPTSSPDSDAHSFHSPESKTRLVVGTEVDPMAAQLNEEDTDMEFSEDHTESPKQSASSGSPNVSFRDDENLAECDSSTRFAPRARTTAEARTSRAWYEFDLAVLVALVSPVGNWLTGGDHIKNLFLIMFLIFYLHQVIEVPWSLYISSRPRRRPSLSRSNAGPTEIRYHELATSELRRYEMFFLFISAVSPFFGAVVLRIVSQTITGEDLVSWFSTALFVLATGIRPWSHIVDRISTRITDLHDVIHYPLSAESCPEDVQTELKEVKLKLSLLQTSLGKLRQTMMDNTENVYEYVEEAVDALELTVKRHEKKLDRHDGRVKDIEVSLEKMKGKAREKVMHINTQNSKSHAGVLHLRYPSLTAYLPQWLLSLPVEPTLSSPQNLRPTRHRPMSPPHPLRIFSTGSDTLETIPEERDNALQQGFSAVLSEDRPAIVLRLFYRLNYIATLPLRSVFRLITNTAP